MDKKNNIADHNSIKKINVDNLDKKSIDKEFNRNYRKLGGTGTDKNVKFPLNRIRSSIKEWRDALRTAESSVPQYYRLIRLFKEVELDAEASSVIQLRNNNVTSRNYYIKKNGEKDDALTEYFQKDNKKWFSKFIKESLNSIYWGYTLFKLEDILDDKLTDITSIKREYYNPKLKHILPNYTSINGDSIEEGEYKDWMLEITPYDEQDDYLGLFYKLSPYCVYLKENFLTLAQLCKRFSMPLPIVKTNLMDEESLQKMEGFLSNLENASYAILNQEDELELATASQSNNTFDLMFEEAKSAITKLVLGNDTINSEKSYVGSAQISAEQAHLYSLDDIHFVQESYEKLRDKLVNLGLDFLEGTELCIDRSGQMNPDDKEFVLKVLETGKYDINDEWLEQKLGIPLKKIERNEEKDQYSEEDRQENNKENKPERE